ncbi:hypothetical protein ACVWU4_000961 [Campylobacter coli]
MKTTNKVTMSILNKGVSVDGISLSQEEIVKGIKEYFKSNIKSVKITQNELQHNNIRFTINKDNYYLNITVSPVNKNNNDNLYTYVHSSIGYNLKDGNVSNPSTFTFIHLLTPICNNLILTKTVKGVKVLNTAKIESLHKTLLDNFLGVMGAMELNDDFELVQQVYCNPSYFNQYLLDNFNLYRRSRVLIDTVFKVIETYHKAVTNTSYVLDSKCKKETFYFDYINYTRNSSVEFTIKFVMKLTKDKIIIKYGIEFLNSKKIAWKEDEFLIKDTFNKDFELNPKVIPTLNNISGYLLERIKW